MDAKNSAIVGFGLAGGVTLGIAFARLVPGSSELMIYSALVGAVLGVLVGRTPFGQRVSGLALGSAVGLAVWDMAIAHYLSARETVGDLAWAMGALVCLLVGALLVHQSGLRGDALAAGTIAFTSIGAHAVARLWLEDYPTKTGLAALVAGAVIGNHLSSARWFRRAQAILLGAAGAGAFAIYVVFHSLAAVGGAWRSPSQMQVMLALLAMAGGVLGWLKLGLPNIPTDDPKVSG
jgi:hypothetical protein